MPDTCLFYLLCCTRQGRGFASPTALGSQGQTRELAVPNLSLPCGHSCRRPGLGAWNKRSHAFLGCWVSLSASGCSSNFSPSCCPATLISLWEWEGWACCLRSRGLCLRRGWEKVSASFLLLCQVELRGPRFGSPLLMRTHPLSFLVWFFPTHSGVHDGSHHHCGLA